MCAPARTRFFVRSAREGPASLRLPPGAILASASALVLHERREPRDFAGRRYQFGASPTFTLLHSGNGGSDANSVYASHTCSNPRPAPIPK
ncbi:MAG: hypothetical protein JWN04_6711 [Myxococcaceae bacterium]|nr:hypothetical protein [Myxococcaceae bacterium]